MSRVRPWRGGGAALVLLMASAAVEGAGLRITPLRLDLSRAQPATQIELANFTGADTPVQVSAYAWSQVDGRDQYAPSKDIFFAPPIVTVPQNNKTVVRFRLRGKAPEDAERAYRVYFQQVTPPQRNSEGGMSFRLRVGVPLFVRPAKPVLPRLELGIEPAGDRLKLTLANSGKAHLKIQGIEVYPASVPRDQPAGEPVARATHSDAGTNYLLPGTRHAWSVALPTRTDLSRHVLLVRTDDFSTRGTTGMNEKGWLWKDLGADGTR